jgi:hypothetical protein
MHSLGKVLNIKIDGGTHNFHSTIKGWFIYVFVALAFKESMKLI